MHHFLNFDYIITLIPFDFLEVKWLNSHIFMRYVDARTYVKFNENMDANHRKEKKKTSTLLF